MKVEDNFQIFSYLKAKYFCCSSEKSTQSFFLCADPLHCLASCRHFNTCVLLKQPLHDVIVGGWGFPPSVMRNSGRQRCCIHSILLALLASKVRNRLSFIFVQIFKKMLTICPNQTMWFPSDPHVFYLSDQRKEFFAHYIQVLCQTRSNLILELLSKARNGLWLKNAMRNSVITLLR